jgi:hypothetical protein
MKVRIVKHVLGGWETYVVQIQVPSGIWLDYKDFSMLLAAENCVDLLKGQTEGRKFDMNVIKEYTIG